MPSLHADQYLGGGIAWAAGEVPLVFAVIILITQWSRQDRKSSSPVSRSSLTGFDDGSDAYAQMLDALAEGQPRSPQATAAGTPRTHSSSPSTQQEASS